jgi:hypothetical protein
MDLNAGGGRRTFCAVKRVCHIVVLSGRLYRKLSLRVDFWLTFSCARRPVQILTNRIKHQHLFGRLPKDLRQVVKGRTLFGFSEAVLRKAPPSFLLFPNQR